MFPYPLFDAEPFERLGAYLGDAHLLEQMAKAFLSRSLQLLGEIEDAVGDDRYCERLHDLMNEALVVQAIALAQCAREAEAAARSGSLAQRRRWLVRLRGCVRVTSNAVRGWLAEQPRYPAF